MVKRKDVLKHYGVKGMKWEDHVYSEEEQVQNIAKKFNLSQDQAVKLKALADKIKADRQANPNGDLSEAKGEIKDAPGSGNSDQSKVNDPNNPSEDVSKAVEEAKATATKAIEDARAAATKAIEDAKSAATKDVEAARNELKKALEEARLAKEQLAKLQAEMASTESKKTQPTPKSKKSSSAKKHKSVKKKTSKKSKVDNSDKPDKPHTKKKVAKKKTEKKKAKKKSGKKSASWGKRLALAIKKKLGMKTKAQLKKERTKAKHRKKKKKKDELKHYGVKGMHWGVRHDEHRQLNPKESKRAGKLKKRINSLNRERAWGKAIKEVHNLSTKDIKLITTRVNLENSLKALTKTKLATKKDKEDYLHRHEMSNEELSRKIARLQAKDNLHQAVKKASKEQREVGIKVAQTAGSLGVNYVLNGGRPTGSKLNIAKGVAKDAMTIWEKPKDSWDKAETDVLNEVERRNQFAGDISKFLVKQYKAKNKKDKK